MNDRPESRSHRFFRAILRALPFDFRVNYENEMSRVFRSQEREVREEGGFFGLLRLWWETLTGILRTAPGEHWNMLRQDCSYAFRMMKNNLGFTLIAIFTLALGIGVNTAIFSVVHAVLLRPLPYADGQQLVFIRAQAERAGVEDIQWSVPEIFDFRQQNQTLSSLVEFHFMSFTLFGHGEPDRVKTGVVSWNYFDVLGVKPILGRTFLPKDEETGAPHVLVLSNEYWRNKFAADPSIVGQTFEMNDRVHTVVGVLPPVPQYPRESDVYMPASSCPSRSSPMMIGGRDMRMMEVFGRLKPGVTLSQAQADLTTIAARLQNEYPKSYPAQMGYVVAASSLKTDLTREAKPTLLVLLAAAAFVLLIACANVANLTLSRMARRERELAVRTALGAGRSRLLRQLLTESFLLALMGGVIGLFLAYGSLQLLTDFVARLSPRAREIQIDSGVLLFTLLAALGTSIVFGSISALFSRVNLNSGLKEGSLGSGTGQQHSRVRSVLIVSQVAFSFLLLIGAGLMLRSLFKLLQVNPGFNSTHVLTMHINYSGSKYGSLEAYTEAGKKLVQRIADEPEVISAAAASSFPLEPDLLAGGPNSNDFQIEGHPLGPGETPPIADVASVSPDFFRTLGIPLISGREFAPTDDANAPPVVIINQSMQRRFWPGENPVGKTVSFEHNGTFRCQIVGVVGDVRDLGLDRSPMLQIYGSMAQDGMALGSLVVRTAADPGRMANQLVRAVHELDPSTAVSGIITLDQARHDSLTPPRITASLLGIFAGLALLIATVGIGGILALTVSQRTHEFGVRIALGARPVDILSMVTRQGMILAVIGIGLGLGGAFFLTRLLKTFLFETTPTDPATYAGVALVFFAAALTACWIPARRAARVDPIVALRFE
ncbi:MAG: ABC transporter permease [Candidatus Acidiferrales bacterium]